MGFHIQELQKLLFIGMVMAPLLPTPTPGKSSHSHTVMYVRARHTQAPAKHYGNKTFLTGAGSLLIIVAFPYSTYQTLLRAPQHYYFCSGDSEGPEPNHPPSPGEVTTYTLHRKLPILSDATQQGRPFPRGSHRNRLPFEF